ncbi:MAG: transglycosylase SLT domain-containing protein [Actinobacteria bacterium]|jgi:soluble lytic murein transglycosylase-like protein|nr:transglycosylase SLT domain-containing protein [Actinomycetota bacterium]
MELKKVLAIGVVTVLMFAAWAGVAGDMEEWDNAPAPAAVDPAEEEAPATAGNTGPSGYEYPGPKEEIPAGPQRLAAELGELRAALGEDIEYWIAEGTPRNDTAKAIALGGLRDQRIARHLNSHTGTMRKVVKALGSRLATVVRRNYKAGHSLSTLTPPAKKVPDWKIYAAAPPNKLLEFYRQAEKRFGVKWYYLAAINLVETRMGRIKGPSSAGARGPMQFMPATWDAYGKGNINDPHDSIMAAGRYLRASGAPEDMRSALYSYNRSSYYVKAIQSYARAIKGNPDDFYVYYYWQVFVRTTTGDVQVTGPGT